MYTGIVGQGMDGMGQGRVKVRVFGIHEQDATILPDEKLPWAQLIMPVTAGQTAGAGSSMAALLPGSWVVGFFRDPGDFQDFVVVGTYNGGMNGAGAAGAAMGYGYGINSAGMMGGSVSGGQPMPLGQAEKDQIQANYGAAGLAHVRLALGDAGRVREVNNSNQGAGIAKYWQYTDYKSGYAARKPYCAAFVSWAIAASNTLPRAACPNTAGTVAMMAWGRRSSYVKAVRHPRSVRTGDIIIFTWSSGSNHAAIATSDSNGGRFQTIEGNCQMNGVGGVWKKNRHLSSINLAMTLVKPA